MDLSKYFVVFETKNIYVDRFLLVPFIKCVLSQIYSHCFRNCTFWFFLEMVKTFVFWRVYISKSFYIYAFYPKTSNFNNWGMVGHKKLPNPSVNNSFNVLLVSLQYTVSFEWPDFALKWLVTITSKGQSLTFKASVWNFHIFEIGWNCNLLFKRVDSNWVIIMEQKRNI